MIRPFVILSLPRCRTHWLSKFLTYRDWTCGHEELRHVRTLEDVKSWMSQPCTGTAETAGAPFWRLIPSDVRIVIIRRPIEQIVSSFMTTMPGVFDRSGLTALMERQDYKISQILRRYPTTLAMSFDELKSETSCKTIFEYCLPYEHDHQWWHVLSGINLQINLPAFLRYTIAYRPQITGAALEAKGVTLFKMRGGQKWHSP